MLGTAGCDTPGETGLAVGSLAALAGGGLGANLATAAATGVAAGTVAAVWQYEASEAQKAEAQQAAEAKFAAMSEEQKSEVKEKAGGRMLVEVSPGPNAASGHNLLAYNVVTKQADAIVYVKPNPPAAGFVDWAGNQAYMP
jgi:hypothetical protein